MKNTVLKNFLVASEKTGRHIVTSFRTGRKYYVEPIGNNRQADWGHYLHNENIGAVKEQDSIVKKENGFDKVHLIAAGSPYDKINKLDLQYPDK